MWEKDLGGGGGEMVLPPGGWGMGWDGRGAKVRGGEKKFYIHIAKL